MAWTSYVLTESLPYWPINPSLTPEPWFVFQLDLARALFAVLPGALLWGASFPLALAAIAAPGEDTGRMVGRVYAANTLGAIVGSLGASLLLTIWLGTQRSQQLMVVLAALSALVLLWRDTATRPWLAVPISLAGAAGADGAAGTRRADRLRPLRPESARAVEGHLQRRGLERLGGRDRAVERRAQLSQRRQGAGVERAAGHAPAADARASHDAHSEDAEARWSSSAAAPA